MIIHEKTLHKLVKIRRKYMKITYVITCGNAEENIQNTLTLHELNARAAQRSFEKIYEKKETTQMRTAERLVYERLDDLAKRLFFGTFPWKIVRVTQYW